MSRLLLPLALAVFALAPARAQISPAPLFTLASPDEGEESLFGAPLEAVGDLDGDGVPDLVASAPDEIATLADGSVVDDAGQIHAFSGATGALIRTYVSPNPETLAYFANAILPVGDRDGDGVADFLASASRETVGGLGNAGRVYLLSGAAGTELAAFTAPVPVRDAEFGFDLARLGDLTGDGTGEIGVSARLERVGGQPSAGRLYIVDGETFETVWTVQAPTPTEDGLFGYTSSDAGDVDGDGVPDVVTGEPGWTGMVDLAGRLHLVSGATGQVIRTARSPNETQLVGFGRWVAGLGDVTGDGVPDVATGANGEQPGGLQYGGRAYVLSGADLAPVFTLVSPDAQAIGFFGEIVEAVPDLDGDGLTDLIVSARAEDDDGIGPNVYIGRVYLFSSATGALLGTLKPPAPDPDGIQYFGYLTASLGDLDGDGFPEIGVGAWGDNPGDSPAYAGRAYVFSGAVAVADELAPAVLALALAVAPNPVAGRAELRATLTRSGALRLDVVDVLGRTVATLVRGEQPAGELRAGFDASSWAPGVYVARLRADGAVRSVRFTVAR